METRIYQKVYEVMEDNYDVIVIGGGTAGSTAALAAAREGARTLIVERNSYLGGSASGGQVTPMMHDGIDPAEGHSSINELIKDCLSREGYAADDHCGNNGWFHPEMLKFTLEELLLQAKVSILYLTELIDTVVENHTITGVLIHNKTGLQLIRGKVYIDCTGDCDVACSCGLPLFVGEEATHRNQSMSLRFMVGNVEIRKLKEFLHSIGEPDYLNYPLAEIASEWKSATPLSNVFRQGRDEHRITYEDGIYIQAFAVPGMPGVMSFNCPEISEIQDALHTASVSRGLIIGRERIKRLFRFVKEALPGFEESFLLSVADMPGIRESRRIQGRYVLSEADYIARAKFEDGIARTAYPIDIHGCTEQYGEEMRPLAKGEYFEIPYRCLVTEEIENLIVAGRGISSTFIAQSSIRIQPTCRALGEAAGIAATYCCRTDSKANELDGTIVKSRMLSKKAEAF